jgi:prolipoprotein diacylglyceryltransferase
VLAQAIGRWGNWFNQELFGRPTDLPWGLEIDPANRPAGYEQYATFHPTFLYESLWCLGVFFVLLWADKRWRMGHGRVFALYITLYSVGRVVWESLRIDEANKILGLRLNVWTALLVVIGGIIYLVVSARRRPGREDPEVLLGNARPTTDADDADDDADDGATQVGTAQETADGEPDATGPPADAEAEVTDAAEGRP